MTQFATKENLQVCLEIFCKYLHDKQGIIVSKKEFGDLRKSMFETMQDIEQGNPGDTIPNMNMLVLVRVKEMFFKKRNIQPANKANVLSLERECQVFGSRNVRVNELIPKRDPYMRKAQMQERSEPVISENNVDLDQVVNERASLTTRQVPDITKLGHQKTEDPEDPAIFMERLKYLEDTRIAIDRSIEKEFREKNNVETQDAKAFLITPAEDTTMSNVKVNAKKGGSKSSDIVQTSRQELLIPPPGGFPSPDPFGDMFNNTNNNMYATPGGSGSSSRKPGSSYITIPKYISINSIDRIWTDDVKRYAYSVVFNGGSGNSGALSKSFKNIRSLQVGKVVIPDEILENYNIKQLAPTRTAFNYEFSFSYPYLILQIDELDDVYDGTNEAIRKSFCKLVYHRSYKAPNGRGYIILKPMQAEKKTFFPSPLSTLNRLSVSILKPNGFLLNNSSDSYKLWKLDYDPFNAQYYQVVTELFFDKNEFFVGDVVVFKGFAISGTSSPNDETALTNFLNRPEGHEILQIGAVNTNGFWRSFFIKAIGMFDRTVGQFVVDTPAVNCLNQYNDGINWNTYTRTNGNILNTSLQNTIGMSLEVMVTDTAGHIDTLLV